MQPKGRVENSDQDSFCAKSDAPEASMLNTGGRGSILPKDLGNMGGPMRATSGTGKKDMNSNLATPTAGIAAPQQPELRNDKSKPTGTKETGGKGPEQENPRNSIETSKLDVLTTRSANTDSEQAKPKTNKERPKCDISFDGRSAPREVKSMTNIDTLSCITLCRNIAAPGMAVPTTGAGGPTHPKLRIARKKPNGTALKSIADEGGSIEQKPAARKGKSNQLVLRIGKGMPKFAREITNDKMPK